MVIEIRKTSLSYCLTIFCDIRSQLQLLTSPVTYKCQYL